ncbi:hypothetical protein AVEN_63406-1 [Araneus ventricosus]|uniref:Uncharacterized protein n=1 Tax=Araneus ventricosus TaxID=182803 RepID=A0A4Y2K663_ARAVE|nr:hypothetical protein AVEN_63406-1 [Araneus ventricosus]
MMKNFICFTSILSYGQPKDPPIKNANSKAYAISNSSTRCTCFISNYSIDLSERTPDNFLLDRRIVKKLSEKICVNLQLTYSFYPYTHIRASLPIQANILLYEKLYVLL